MRNGFIILFVLSVFLGGCIFLPPEGTPSNGHFTSWDTEGLEDPDNPLGGASVFLFINKDVGLAGGWSSKGLGERNFSCLWRTEDGGYHWKLTKLPGHRVKELVGVDGFVYAVTEQSYNPRTYGFWESHDLGLTWKLKTELASPYGVNDLYFRDTLHGFMRADGYYLTTDGGKTWQEERWLNRISVREITDSLVYGVLHSDHKIVGCWNYVTRREMFRTEMPYDAFRGHFSNGFLAFEHDKRLKVYRLGADNRYHLLKGCNYKADWVNYIRHEEGHIYLHYNLNLDNKLLYSGDGGKTWQRRRTWSSIIDYCTYYEPDTLHLWYSCHTDMGHFKN